MVYKSSKETQERKDLKKRHILETAIKVFSQKGYYGTTVKDVVEEADISVGTFYFYFKNKEELFDTLYDSLIDEFYSALFNSLGNLNKEIDLGFGKAIAFFLKAIELNRPLAKILLIEAVGLNSKFEKKRYEVTQKYVNYASEYYKVMQQLEGINIPDVKVFALSLIGTLYNVIMEWLQSDTDTKLTDYAYALTIYNLQALGVAYNDDSVRKGIKEILEDDSLTC